MTLTSLLTSGFLGLASLTATEAETPKALILTEGAPAYETQMFIAQAAGDYMTTAQGCTYRKTQAPGYPPRWILVVNPHHIGGRNATGRCKGML